jgi:hypothetical protein
LKPQIYHLTDGFFSSEKDEHLHYGEGDFPISKFLKLIPQNAKITNEAKHNYKDNLNDFLKDTEELSNIFYTISTGNR